MMKLCLALPIAVILLAGVKAEGTEEVARDGYSQQYHYNSYPAHHEHAYNGLSFDLSTGLFLILGAIIVLITLCAILGPLGKGDYGWSGTQYASYRNMNVAGLSEKVLNGIEKLYEQYNKAQ